jgi:hypothetical protein
MKSNKSVSIIPPKIIWMKNNYQYHEYKLIQVSNNEKKKIIEEK